MIANRLCKYIALIVHLNYMLWLCRFRDHRIINFVRWFFDIVHWTFSCLFDRWIQFRFWFNWSRNYWIIVDVRCFFDIVHWSLNYWFDLLNLCNRLLNFFFFHWSFIFFFAFWSCWSRDHWIIALIRWIFVNVYCTFFVQLWLFVEFQSFLFLLNIFVKFNRVWKFEARKLIDFRQTWSKLISQLSRNSRSSQFCDQKQFEYIWCRSDMKKSWKWYLIFRFWISIRIWNTLMKFYLHRWSYFVWEFIVVFSFS